MNRRLHPPTCQTPPHRAPLPAWLMKGLENRKSLLAEASDPGPPHAFLTLMPVPPESGCGHRAGGPNRDTMKHPGSTQPGCPRPTPGSRMKTQEPSCGLHQAFKGRTWGQVSQSQGAWASLHWGGGACHPHCPDGQSVVIYCYAWFFFINELSDMPGDQESLSEGEQGPPQASIQGPRVVRMVSGPHIPSPGPHCKVFTP